MQKYLWDHHRGYQPYIQETKGPRKHVGKGYIWEPSGDESNFLDLLSTAVHAQMVIILSTTATRRLVSLPVGLLNALTLILVISEKRWAYFVSLEIADLFRQFSCIMVPNKKKMSDKQMFYRIKEVCKWVHRRDCLLHGNQVS